MTAPAPRHRSLSWFGWFVLALLLGAVVWLTDRSGAGTSLPPSTNPDANGVAVPAVAAVPSLPAPQNSAEVAAVRVSPTVPTRRARLQGRVVFGGMPLPAATVSVPDAPPATTANDGSFVLEVAPGRHTLAIDGAGTARGSSWGPVRVASGQTFVVGDVVVPLPASLRGQVVDEDGAPIAAALVVLAQRGDGWGANQVDRQAAEFPRHAVTRPDGRFHIDALLPHESSLQVERSGYYYGWERYQLAPGQDLELGAIVLRARPPLRGVVLGPDGAAREGARVVAGGIQHDPLRQRSAVTTDARGAFELDPRSGDAVTVFANGCEPKTVRHEGDAMLFVTLSAAHQLQGLVAGSQGRAGSVRIERVPGDYDERPQWLLDLLEAPVPIASDGTFSVIGLPAGRWQCRADVPGGGRSAYVVVAIPATEPVRLELLPQRTVRLEVVDDIGTPIAEAVVTAVAKLPGAGEFQIMRDRVQLDAEGAADLVVCNGHEPRLGLESIDHASVQRAVGADETAVRVVMPRHGRVTGTVSNPELTSQCRLVVQVKSAKGVHVASVDVDRTGAYGISLPTGDHVIELIAVDASHFNDHELPVAVPVPLVSEFELLGASVTVTVRSGETAVVDLSVPAFAEIRGRVIAQGKPLAGAIVYAAWSRFHDRFRSTDRGPDRYEQFPHQRTDGAGAFRFLVSSGRAVELYARHGRNGVWSTPSAVAVASGERRQVEIVLAAASIRGRVDLTAVPLRERSFLKARLCPIAEADTNDIGFSWGEQLPPSFHLPKSPLAPDGSFVFDCVPPGGHVLRIGDTYREDLVQCVVNTTSDEIHDLGLLAAPTRHPVKLAVEDPPSPYRIVHAVLPTAGNERGVFAGAGGLHDGVLDLGTLPVGSYRLLLFEAAATWQTQRARIDATAEIAVADDGTVTPARVSFTGHR